MSLTNAVGAGLLASAVMLGLPAAVLAQGTATPAAPAAGATGQATPNQNQRQPSAAQAAQQERMRSCNSEAGTRHLEGDARRSFMSDCLAGRMPPAAGNQPSAAQAAQQDRMRSCNAEAGTRHLAGDARRSFMSDCLAGRTTSGAGAASSPTTSAAPANPAQSGAPHR